MSPQVTISIVSHCQNALVNQLVQDIGQQCKAPLTLILTQNVQDPEPLARAPAGSTEVIVNTYPKGFGANHNAAFARCRAPLFCVLNPDIRLQTNPFPKLIELLSEPSTGVVAPLVRAPSGRIEDSARRFPTLVSLAGRLLRRHRGPDYPTDRGPIKVDWVAGMFMLFRSDVFRALQGFDEAYFLYYEDVDLCHRLHERKFDVVYDPGTEVIHDARRDSHRNPRLMAYHLASIARYFSRRSAATDRQQ